MQAARRSMTYEGDRYTDASALNYYLRSNEQHLMHPQLRQELEFLLTMLRDEGEEKTFAYIKNHVLKGDPFPWEQRLGDGKVTV